MMISKMIPEEEVKKNITFQRQNFPNNQNMIIEDIIS